MPACLPAYLPTTYRKPVFDLLLWYEGDAILVAGGVGLLWARGSDAAAVAT